jgi:outer membrane lipoprotein carrier protein
VRANVAGCAPVRGIAHALLWFALLLTGVAQAAAIDNLRAFMRETRTLRADFVQTVYDRAGQIRQQSAGTMEFLRPGRFRWSYEKPFEQLIVGDGAKLWVYDRDLKQVTVKKLPEALGSSPAALLAGDNEIEKFYDLVDSGSQDGLGWLTATPKTRDTPFESIRMGFNGAELKVMELKDNFGGRTVIRFERIERNPRLAPERFRFTVPAGVDVVGD